MAITAPYSLTATMISSSRINLAWANTDVWSSVKIERKAAGGSYAQIASVSGSTTSYPDTSCQDGTLYYYRVRAYEGTPLFEYSSYSNEASATTKLDAPSGLSGSATNTTVDLIWNDNCQNESGFKIYKDGAYLATVGANIETYEATGLTPGTWYTFTVKAYNAATTSAASNSELIWTADPPAKPSGLVATATGTTTATLNWKDNADNEVDQHIERSSTSATAGFSQIGTVNANITTYADTGLTSNTQYWYRVRAHNASGYSAYCTVATAVTWAAIAAPTNLTAEAFSGTGIDIRFVDNSELEDFHCLERKTGAGAYSEIVQLAPNRTFYRNTGLSSANTYTYRVRAKQGAATYSSYSNEAAATPLAVPIGPFSGLVISEYQDTWARLTWTKVPGITGYRIAQSTPDESAYAVIASIDNDADYFKVTGLTPNTTYYWKLLMYNGAGDSGYSVPVHTTTRTAYLPSKFEKLIRKSKPKLRFHVEGNPLMQLSGWTLTAAQTYTYELPFDERGAEIDTIHENGVALTEKTSIATVEATASTWWHDTVNGLIYIHTSDGTDPVDFTITGSFWVRFTTWKTADEPAVFNGNDYLPLIAADGIPDITQEVQQYYGDNFIITSGQISLINGKINKQFHFDKLFAKYIWLNRKMKILAGGPGFTYNELVAINTGIINTMSVSDQRANFDLRDYRDGLHKALPTEKFSMDEFPRLNENSAGQVRQLWFGTVTNVVPVCIDTTNRVFEFHNGRFKSVTELRQNGVALAKNTDYFVDYGLGQFTLARSLTWTINDTLIIDFVGMTNTADEAISNGADIFKYAMNEWLNVPTSDLDLDSIYRTKYECTQALTLGLWKETGSQEFIRRIEQSIMAYSIQDAEGRLGLRSMQTAAVSGIKYISSLHVFDLAIEKNQESIFSSVNFYYGENPSEDKFSLLTKTINTIPWLYNVSKSLDVYVAIASEADTETLAALVLADLNKQKISFSVPRNLYTNFPGDLIYFNRDRFPSLSGVVSNLLIRILSISKQYSSGRTQITAEVV